MKLLKILGISLLVVLALSLIAALFISGNYDVTETVIVDRPKDEVFAKSKILRIRNSTQVTKNGSPNGALFRGGDGTVGFICGWRSKNPAVGSGEQEISRIKDGKRIHITSSDFRSLSNPLPALS